MEKAHSGTNQSSGGREDSAAPLRNVNAGAELWDTEFDR